MFNLNEHKTWTWKFIHLHQNFSNMLSALDQSSAVEWVNCYLYCIEQQKSFNTSIILEYDKESRDLHAWLWYVCPSSSHWLAQCSINLHKYRPVDDKMKKWLALKELEKHQETNNFHTPFCLCAILEEDIKSTEAVRGTPKFQYSDSATLWLMQHFAISATLCNHLPKKSHWVTTPIDHPVRVAYCLPLPHCSPFHFCALLLPSYSISIMLHILFPILSIFHILPLSLFCDLLLVAMHSVPYVVPLCLGSP